MLEEIDKKRLSKLIQKSLLGIISITMFGGVLGSALRYVYNIIVGRFFGPEALGIFAIGFVIIKGVGSISRLGLGQASKKFVPLYLSDNSEKNLSEYITLSLLLPFLTGVLIISIYFMGTRAIEFQFRHQALIELFILGIPVFTVFITGINILYAFGDHRSAVLIRDIIFSSLLIIGALVATFFKDGTAAVMWAYIISLGIGMGLVLYVIYLQKNLSINISRYNHFKKVLHVSIPLNISAILVFVLGWSDIIMVSYFLTTKSVGWYQATLQTSLLLTLLPTAIDRVFPVYISSVYEDKESRIGPIFKSVTKWTFFLSFMGGLIVSLYAGELLKLFDFGAPQLAGILIILLVGQVVSAVAQTSQSLLFVTEYQKLESINNFTVLVLNILLNIFLIPRYGLIGAAIATTLSYMLLAFAQLVEVRLLFGISPLYIGYWKGGLTLLIITPLIVFVNEILNYGLLEIPVVGLLYVGLFLLSIYLLGIDDIDRRLLNRL